MAFSSQEETRDSNVPTGRSSRTSITRNVQYRGSSETTQSYQGSISNSSVHTISTATTHEDLLDPLGRGPDRNFPIPNHKSSHSLEKQAFGLRNHSLSTVSSTTSEPKSDCSSSSVEPSTPMQELRSLRLGPSLENEAVSSLLSTPRSSAYSPVTDTGPSSNSNYGVTLSTPLNDLLTKPYGDSRPPATMEISKADKAPTIRPAPFLPSPTDRLDTTSRSRSGTSSVKGKKGVRGFMTDILSPNKRPEITTPHDLVHLTHVGYDPSTSEFTGFPQEWQDWGISKFDQDAKRFAILEIDKLYQEGGDDVRDGMGLAPAQGSSRRLPIPNTAHASFPEEPAPIGAAVRELPNSSIADVGLRSPASKTSNSPVVEPQDHRLLTAPQQQSTTITSSAKTASAIPRRRVKKKDDEANDADIVEVLEQIRKGPDPTWYER